MHLKLENEIKNKFLTADIPEKISPNNINVLITDPALKPIRQLDTSETSKIKLKKILTLGKEKYQKQDYNGALKLYLEGQKLSPNNTEIQFLIKKVNLKINGSELNNNVQSNIKNKGDLETKIAGDEVVPVKESFSEDSVLKKNSKDQESPVAIPVNSLNGASLKPEQPRIKNTNELNAPPASPIAKTELDGTEIKSSEERPKEESTTKKKQPNCISCMGSGKCYWCSGTGNCDRCGGSGTYLSSACTMCNGSGKCNSCNGKGICLWCNGKGISIRKMNTIYTKENS